MEEHLEHRKEQYRLRRDRKTPEEAERRKHKNQEYMQRQRATMTAKQRRLVRTRNVQVNMPT